MRIATWNINGLRARLEFVQHWLRDRQPDVVGLQELKLTDEQFPHDAIADAGYRAVTHGQKAWNGVAILTRVDAEAATVTRAGLPGQEDFGARLLTADVAGMSFTTLYCPNGKTLEHDDYPRKLAWYDSLAEHVAATLRPEDPVVLCGDFNICPSAQDTWDAARHEGQIFHTEAERAGLQRLLDWGLVDIFRHEHPDSSEFSWWDYRGGAFHRKHGLRIDFLLGTQSLLSRVRNVEIDREYRKKKDGLTASDHAPVFADLD